MRLYRAHRDDEEAMVRENPERCAAEVWKARSGHTAGQCRKMRGYGPGGIYCWQHARRLEQGQVVPTGREENGDGIGR